MEGSLQWGLELVAASQVSQVIQCLSAMQETQVPFIFFPTSCRRVGLLFWVPDVLCRHSEVVLWNLLDV